MNCQQNTIKKEFSLSGTGLHTNKFTRLTLRPAAENTGIRFQLNQKTIPLTLSQVLHCQRSITLGTENDPIMTIEHLAAALYMLQISNCLIEIDNNEVPALDGSAKTFIQYLKKAGQKKQNAWLSPARITAPVSLFDQEKFIIALPSDVLKITYAVDFPHPSLKNKSIHFNQINEKIFIQEIAPARTFGFRREIDELFKKGLALGGNLDNAVVLTETGIENKKLRFPDECIRHKVLDFLGALALLQRPVFAHFLIYKSGHKLDIAFLNQFSGAVNL